jgi:hypothetical protein
VCRNTRIKSTIITGRKKLEGNNSTVFAPKNEKANATTVAGRIKSQGIETFLEYRKTAADVPTTEEALLVPSIVSGSR